MLVYEIMSLLLCGCSRFCCRGDPSRASSTSVIRMGPALATHKGEGQGVLHPRTEAEQQLQELLHKQLDVTKEGFERSDTHVMHFTGMHVHAAL